MGPDFVHTICLEAFVHFPKWTPWKLLKNQGIAGFMFFSDPVSWIAMDSLTVRRVWINRCELWSNHGWSIRCLDGSRVTEPA